MAALRPVRRALVDTSVIIDPPEDLVDYAEQIALSTITVAELAFGLHSGDPLRNEARRRRLDVLRTRYHPIAYSESAALAYGALCEIVARSGRAVRPRRFDLLLASVAVDQRVPLLTRNPRDFVGLGRHVEVIPIPA